MVISGDYKGRTGEVIEVIPKQNRAVVEGVNIVKKHIKATQTKAAASLKCLLLSIFQISLWLIQIRRAAHQLRRGQQRCESAHFKKSSNVIKQ